MQDHCRRDAEYVQIIGQMSIRILDYQEDLKKLLKRIAIDGFPSVKRKGGVAIRNDKGLLAFSPPLLSDIEFDLLKDKIENDSACRIQDSVVLTADQYQELMRLGFANGHPSPGKAYIWLNSPYRRTPYQFDAAAWILGLITGTSLIPLHKFKELLPRGG